MRSKYMPLDQKLVGRLLMSLAILPLVLSVSEVNAQARTIWGTSYTLTGTSPNQSFSFVLPGVTVTAGITRTSCQTFDTAGGSEAFPNGLNSTTPGFFLPMPPTGTTGMGLNNNRNGTIAGCSSPAAITQNFAMTFSAPVDPQALRFHWNNFDAGSATFSALTPNKLAGNTAFDVVGNTVNQVAANAVNFGCQANNGTNPSASCGTVNFTSSSATVMSAPFSYTDVDSSAAGGDGHTFAASLNQPSLLLRKRTIGAGGSNSFAYSYPSNVVSNAASGNVAATSEIIAVASNGTFVSGVQRYIANSGLDTIVTEAVPAGWRLTSAQCYDVANGNAPVATLSAPVVGPAAAAVTLPAAAVTPTAQVQCDFTNVPDVDLSITKTNTPGVNGDVDQPNDTVNRGATITYRIVARNNGPGSVVGAIVRDTPTTGITCPSGNAVSISGNGVPAGTYTVGNLTSAGGIALAQLNSGQSATITFQCTVN